MLKIDLIVVGKLKESYLKEGIQDYLHRSRFYADIQIREIKDFGNDFNRELARKKESELIFQELSRFKSYSFLLDLQGKKRNSIEMAKHLTNLQNRGISRFTWIIGGSYGVHSELKKSVNEQICFSDFTFPHGLMRLILSEQIYRWLTIMAGKNYHK